MHWRRLSLLATVGLVVLRIAVAEEATNKAVAFKHGHDSVAIEIGGRPFATYVYRDPEILRPYFAHVRTPSGLPVTRNHPPVAGNDATDHATFHPGLWLAFGDISGADFWRNKAQVEHVEFVESPQADLQGGHFVSRHRYRAGDRTVCEELCRIDIRPLASGTVIAWESRFSGPEPFAFGDQEEMGLGVRMATPLTVKGGGEILNSRGQKNERQVWGQTADWCDYHGTIEGQPAGVMLIGHPGNVRPCWFHARDYGVLVANPFGRRAFTKGDESKIEVRPGEPLRWRFAALVHSGVFDPAAAYQEWLTSATPKK